jgi:hypothetical protein
MPEPKIRTPSALLDFLALECAAARDAADL